jgi:hypothetical protein
VALIFRPDFHWDAWPIGGRAIGDYGHAATPRGAINQIVGEQSQDNESPNLIQ